MAANCSGAPSPNKAPKLRSVRKCPECEGTRLRREARFVHVEGETLRTACEFEPGFRVRKRFAFGVGHGRGAVKMQVGTLQVSVFDAVIGCGVTDFGFAVVVVA